MLCEYRQNIGICHLLPHIYRGGVSVVISVSGDANRACKFGII